MNAFYLEMVDLAVELLGPGEDTFGEQLRMYRPAGQYDKEKRRKISVPPQEQTVWGTLDSELSPASASGTLTRVYERVLTAVPVPGGFEPGVDDRVVGEGRTYQVLETAHVIKAGLSILWICGLKST